MRRLLLLRHAKAAAPSGADDFHRALTESGRRDARKIGEWLAASGFAPDRCVYSGALRTRETFEIVARALPPGLAASEQNLLYEAPRFLIVGLLRETPDDARAQLVIGHNPGMGEVANLLCGESAAADRLRLAAIYPTGALAVIAFDRPDWSELAPRTGRLERFVIPADL